MSWHCLMTSPDHPSDIDCQAEVMTQVDTLLHPIALEEAANPNTVKVALANCCDALSFSRAPISSPILKTLGHF
jgi:CMP-2-keto-3-deoxyoctulosonic acid synthetase